MRYESAFSDYRVPQPLLIYKFKCIAKSYLVPYTNSFHYGTTDKADTIATFKLRLRKCAKKGCIRENYVVDQIDDIQIYIIQLNE